MSLNAPANNTMLAVPATVNLSAAAADTNSPLAKVEFYRDATLIATVTTPTSGTTSSGTYTSSDTNVAPGTYSYTAKAYDSANPGMVATSQAVPVTVTAAGAASVNVAAAANGGVATASSTYSGSFPASGAINGDRKGLNWGNGGGWNDLTANGFPDWLQVNFNGVKSIGEIDVFTLQDNYAAPVEPTPAMTFTQSGITAFQVQYWDGGGWVTVPGGNVTTNNLIWRRFAFSPISTDRIRVLVSNALQSYSRIVELEAWTVSYYQIAGTVTASGAPLEGVAFSGDGGGASCSSSNASGQYNCMVPPGWVGSVTPSLTSYNLTPASRSYSGVQANQTAQDYVGAIAQVAVTGTLSAGGAPLAGVPVAATNGATCASSDAAGHYSCTATRGWSGSVMPLGGYSFTSMSRSYGGVMADQAEQDFAGVASTVNIYSVQVDHLNTPRSVTDQNGNEVWRWDNTEPFGDSVPNGDPNNTGNVFEFPQGLSSYYRDRETGTSYAMLRDAYDPTTGRFPQSDPIGLRGGINPYAYALSNPLRYTDPFGLYVTMTCRPVSAFGRAGMSSPVHCAVFVWHYDNCGRKVIDAQYSLAGGGTRPTRDPSDPTFVADTGAFGNPGGPNANYPIPVPPGMSQRDFDQAVTNSGNNYSQGPYMPVPGPNSNTAASNIISNAGGAVPNVPGAWGQGAQPFTPGSIGDIIAP